VVLVTEDEPSVRQLCLKGLQRLGYRTIAAGDGPEALTVLASSARVDLLLTDVVMPRGMSGPELATAARRRRPELKVLFMSAYLPSSFDAETRAQVRPLLSKPFSSAELARLVGEAIGRR
jgi:CheY-like chemotaxis protein